MRLTGFFLFVLPLGLLAQPKLSLQDALQDGLKFHFEVKIARNELDIARENNTAAMAGFYPSAVLNLNSSFQNSNISQRFASGLEVDRPGVLGNALSGGILVNWLFFDGGRMFIARKRLSRQLTLAELRLQNQLFAYADTVSAAYYQTVLAKLELGVLLQSKKMAEERIRITDEQIRNGTRSRQDFIQGQMDLNQILNRIVAQEKQIQIRKGALNLLTGKEPDLDFEPSDSIRMPDAGSFQEAKKQVLERNMSLRILRENIENQRLIVDETKSRIFPQLGLNLSLNYQRTSSTAGFALYNRNLGPFAGLSFSMPVFNAVPLRKQINLAKKQLDTEELRLKLAENRLTFQLWKVIKTLEIWLESHETESKTVSLAEENFRLAQDRFRMGQATALDLRDAETQLENAKLRKQQYLFQARMTGNQLLRLSSELKTGE